MRIKGSGFQYDTGDRQERLHEADLAPMSVNFASHRRRKAIWPDGVTTIAPTRLTIAGFALATISTFGRSLFHRRRNIVAHFHFGKIHYRSLVIGHRDSCHCAPRIHSQGERLRVLMSWRCKELDGKGRASYHPGFPLFEQEPGDSRDTRHQGLAIRRKDIHKTHKPSLSEKCSAVT